MLKLYIQENMIYNVFLLIFYILFITFLHFITYFITIFSYFIEFQCVTNLINLSFMFHYYTFSISNFKYIHLKVKLSSLIQLFKHHHQLNSTLNLKIIMFFVSQLHNMGIIFKQQFSLKKYSLHFQISFKLEISQIIQSHADDYFEIKLERCYEYQWDLQIVFQILEVS